MIFPNQCMELLSQITQSRLKKQIQFLRMENRILRGHYVKHHIRLTEKDKNRILKYGLPLGPDIRKLISIVSYATFRSWIRQLDQPKTEPKKRGRPRKITLEIKHLIVHMAKHNKWGYTKILGELKKLHVIKTSKTSIRNILKEYGIDPVKYRSDDTWDDFLKRTFQTLWACDFFTKSIWTPLGRRMYYVLFFINIKTRKVYVSVTKTPTQTWLIGQLKHLQPVFEESQGRSVLIRDRDNKFTKTFDEYFQNRGINIMTIPYRSPNLNPYAESWVATIKRECLNHFVVLGQVHLEYLVREFVKYYNQYRPHSSMDNRTLEDYPLKLNGQIYAKPILGGLTIHYYRR